MDYYLEEVETGNSERMKLIRQKNKNKKNEELYKSTETTQSQNCLGEGKHFENHVR